MDVQSPFITNGQPPEVIEPGERALHDPSVLAQLLTAVDPSPSDAGNDAPLPQRLPIRLGVVTLIGVQLAGSSPRSASPSFDGRNSIYHHFQRFGIRYVSGCAS